MEESIDTDIELDTRWIKEFDATDKEYEDFYLDDVNSVRLFCIYINNNNEILFIKSSMVLMKTPNYIDRDELLSIIKKGCLMNNTRYTILSMLQYNFSLMPQNIDGFLKNSLFDIMNENIQFQDNPFMKTIKHIDTIKWERTIKMFKELNGLYVFFYENKKSICRDEKTLHNSTKRIHLKTTNCMNHKHNNRHNKTYKKIV